jgi:hypothetical protein
VARFPAARGILDAEVTPMKTGKRVLAMTAVVALALSLGACSMAGKKGGGAEEMSEGPIPPLTHTAAPFWGYSVSGGGSGVQEPTP